MNNKSKSVIISGAGSGIGKAIAIALSQEGFDLFLFGRNKIKLEETIKKCLRPKNHNLIVADVRDPCSYRNEMNVLMKKNLCAVIANAGVGGENIYGSDDRWSEIISTNLNGTYCFVNESLSALKNSKEEFKHIIVISSILAKIGVPNYSAYSASKAGLLGLARSWANEFSSHNILVNSICPGWVDTKMSERGILDIAQKMEQSRDETLAQQMQLVPLNKMSSPREIAHLVKYITSSEQKSITGNIFDINNGAYMS